MRQTVMWQFVQFAIVEHVCRGLLNMRRTNVNVAQALGMKAACHTQFHMAALSLN